MSLLFDQNLSRRLVALLSAEYPGAEHVSGAGLLGADDLTVWHYAAERTWRSFQRTLISGTWHSCMVRRQK